MIKRAQKGMITVADRYAVGPYCGAKMTSISSWKEYGLFRRVTNGFSVGPLFFWKKVNGKW